MSKAKNKILILITVFVASFAIAVPAFAFDFGLTYLTSANLGNLDLRVTAMSIVNVALGFLGILGILIILYGGFIWMTSGGKEDQVQKAKRILVNGTIGLVIILISLALTSYILHQLGIATGMFDPCNPATDTTELCPSDPACKERECLATEFWSVCYDQSPLPPGCGPSGPTCAVDNIMPSGVITIQNPVVRAYFDNPVDELTVNFGNYQITVNGATLGNGAGPCFTNDVCLSDDCDLGTNTCNGDFVAGSITMGGLNALEFRPDTDCADACGGKCFSANTRYDVFVGLGITCENGEPISGAPYSTWFETGSAIDCDPPIINSLTITDLAGIPVTQVCAGPAFSYFLESNFYDDGGVATVNFSENQTPFSAIDNNGGVGWGPGSNNASTNPTPWPTGAYSVGDFAELIVDVQDYDDHNTSRSFWHRMRAGHCCDGVLNSDEDGIDCGGADCGACVGAACDLDVDTAGCQEDDTICASYFCENTGCTCQKPPRIDYVSPALDQGTDDLSDDEPYGPEGSLVTIFGRNFGTVPGAVTFLGDDTNGDLEKEGDADDLPADLPSSVNALCTQWWFNDHIIVVVPVGAVAGPIKIEENTTPLNMSDRTDDFDDLGERIILDFEPQGYCEDDPSIFCLNTANCVAGGATGPCILDFPGICAFTPASAAYEELIIVQGVGLGDFSTAVPDDVSFGSLPGNLSDVGAGDITDASIADVGVPNLVPQIVNTWVDIGGRQSNYLPFLVTPPPNNPIIYDFTPKTGPSGTYVTISGENFYDIQGAGNVYLYNGVYTVGNFNFPIKCATEYWSNNQIIVKVPTLGNGDYSIIVRNNDYPFSGYEASSAVCSEDQYTACINSGMCAGTCGGPLFDVDSSLPLAPGICLMQPNNGPYGKNVNIYGDYFPLTVDGRAKFYSNATSSVPATVDYTRVSSQEANTTVTINPTPQTGPANVVDISPAPGSSYLISNDYFFRVGDCTQGTNACVTGEECCFGGPYQGSCMAEGQCAGKANISVYLWQFTTGTPGPRVVELCNRQRDCSAGYCAHDISTTCRFDSECGVNGPCVGAFSSPSPVQMDNIRNDGAVPVNSIVTARFDQEMREISLVSSTDPYTHDNITVQRCNPTGSGYDSTACSGNITGPVYVYSWEHWENPNASAFRFCPDVVAPLNNNCADAGDVFDDNYWYRVILNNNIQNTTGSGLVGNGFEGPPYGRDYVFIFRTGSESGDVGCIGCEPQYNALYMLYPPDYEGWSAENYSGDVYAQDNECVLLNPYGYDWQFSTPAAYADFVIPPPPPPANTVRVHTVDETIPDWTPVTASIPSTDADPNFCKLFIDFSTPVVIDKWPDCSSACLNAEIGAAFSRRMEPLTLNLSNIYLYNCFGDSFCETGLDEVSITTPQYIRYSANTCGNKAVEPGEDCDDGNLQAGDGCNERCINEGTIQTCGNDSVEKGEDCDDGNTNSGDGCSRVCIHEGSTGTAVCGNATIEYCDGTNVGNCGEDCDGSIGCTSNCLNTGATSYARNEVYFYPLPSENGGVLIPGAWYRVVLCDDITSNEDINLGLLNFNSDVTPNPCASSGEDSYSWVFRTQVDFNLCELGRVEVTPERRILRTSETELYRSAPYSEPDECSPVRGQRLNPYLYEWCDDQTNPQVDCWYPSNPSAADIKTSSGTLVADGPELRDTCGNRVIEIGEGCDDGNIKSGDGCTGIDTSAVDTLCNSQTNAEACQNTKYKNMCAWITTGPACNSCLDYTTAANCRAATNPLYPKCWWNSSLTRCEIKPCVKEGNSYQCGSGVNLAPNPGFEEIRALCPGNDGVAGVCPSPFCCQTQDPDCPVCP